MFQVLSFKKKVLDANLIRQNPEIVKKGISAKNASPKLVDDFLALDDEWRKLVKEIDDRRANQNKLTRERKIREAKELKNKIQNLEADLRQIEKNREEILYQLPNLPLDDAPVGKDERDNVVIREVGDKPKFNFQPKDYLEIAEKLDLIDIERAGKVSGSRFGYIKGKLALLEFALVKLAFDVLEKEGFMPIVPPVMIKNKMMEAMGYLESSKFKVLSLREISQREKNSKLNEEVYFLRDDDLVLVGTSEQSIGPMHSDEIFSENDLPKRYSAFSTCFRREAGSYGKDTKGILRVHQFDKVEMFSFCQPDKSKEEHKFLLSLEEKLMQALKIPYRVVQICTGDLGVPAAAKYDIEAWLPGQNQHRETHSTSNCTDFQARRLNIKYKLKTQNSKLKTDFVHALNGTAFAVGRTLIAIIENYQQKDGTISVPKALQKYLGFDKIG